MSALAVEDWLADIAPAPNPGGRPAKSRTGRMRKVHCMACGCIVYASRGALQRSGLPICGCGEAMQLANLRDRWAVEPDALEAELVGYGREAYNAAAAELGLARIGAVSKPRQSGAAQRRCQWEHGNCVKFCSGRYCPEHEHSAAEMGTSARRAA